MGAVPETMFSGHGKVPWHRIGNVVQGTPTSEEAIKLAGLDWQVEKHPLFARIPNPGDKEHGVFKRADSKFATVRMDSKSVLGIVGSDYTPVQNSECFGMLDSLVAQGNAQYETAGSLWGGATVFMLLCTPEPLKIAGDAIKPFFLATTAHDGSGRIRVRNVSTRVVCENTLAAAMGENVRAEFIASHTKSVHDKMKQAAKVLGLISDTSQAFIREANDLLSATFTRTEFEVLAKQLTGQPDPTSATVTDREVRAWEKRFDAIMRTAYGAQDLNDIRSTKWGALNAVADYEQHLVRVTGTETRKVETLFKRSFLDAGLTRKAHALLTA